MPQEALITIATRHQSHLERLKAHEVAKFDAFLKRMDRDIRDILTRVGGFGTIRQLEKLLERVDVALKGTLDDYEKVWRESVRDVALYEAGFEGRSIESVVDGVSLSIPADSVIMAAVYATPLGNIGGAAGGSLLKPLLKDFSKGERARMQKLIRLGFAEGQTTQQILERIRGTRAARYRDGALAIMKRNQESITRTALQHAAMQARNQVWDDNRSVIRGVRITATLDSKTSSICRSLDGKEYPIDKGPRPPFHIRCRTSTVAILKKEYQFLSKGRTRAARDPKTGKVEKVSASKSYYAWLKDQPASVQDSIIGKTRGKLLRNGGLSADRFAELQLSKNFKPLTLEQMRDMEPVAFEKAGL